MDRKIKKDGSYKSRFVTVASKKYDPNYTGYTFAPTACVKVIWLIFVVATLLKMKARIFYIKRGF
jgi:hypothetical protein